MGNAEERRQHHKCIFCPRCRDCYVTRIGAGGCHCSSVFAYEITSAEFEVWKDKAARPPWPEAPAPRYAFGRFKAPGTPVVPEPVLSPAKPGEGLLGLR